ncbi:MAG: Rpn family recombination-promoting nuclease/putative transposase [Defluviitaleaceae bacterium]|nr:Rpn family recombination-promoting nuclease/putative transposase [Defluviitaleaceae bacterium]
MAKLKYTFKTDSLFKILFVKYPDLLKRLVAELLSIKYESIEQLSITNPEMTPEELGKKFCRLDINMILDGKHINLEIQVDNEGNYLERSLFYWAREYSTSINEGDDFALLPPTIVISILDFKLFDCEEFHSEFRPLEVTRHTPLTDKMILHYYELKKLPPLADEYNGRDLWLQLFNAQTEEDLSKIDALGVSVMNEAISAYRHVAASPEFREIERMRSKARHDEAQALSNARRKEREHWQGVVAEMEAEKDAHWQGVVAEMEAEKDAENAELRKQLEALRSQLEK